jgi:hypothetical protein
MNYELPDLVDIVKVILKDIPDLVCCDFHHAKIDRHEEDRDCPISIRFRSAVENARDFLEEYDKKGEQK